MNRSPWDRIKSGLGYLTIADTMIEKLGPALNGGRAILLYGPPGNGKTSIALSFANVFSDIIYVPYAVEVEGQIMRVFDPSFHKLPAQPAAKPDAAATPPFAMKASMRAGFRSGGRSS